MSAFAVRRDEIRELVTRTRTAATAAGVDEATAVVVVAELADRRRPAAYFTTAENAVVPALAAAGIVRGFRDGAECWLELAT